MRCTSWLLFLALLVGPIVGAQAAVKTPALISDGMVLQRGMKVPIWGTATPGEQVTVQFQDQKRSTTAGKDGHWMVRLDPLTVGGPYEMTIHGENDKVIRNILVGEVWICSGQSNMEMSVGGTAHAGEDIAHSANPHIRLLTVPHNGPPTPAQDVRVRWSDCGPSTVGSFSAVAYFFGRDLQKALNVPVGLIHTSVGGTPAELWTSKEVLESTPELKGVRGSQLYNGMIAPLIPYAMRGVIWYQGESNAGQAVQYQTLFPAMIEDWRSRWGEGTFPFLFVQLAPFMDIKSQPEESAWAELREAQRLTSLRVPNTAMAVIVDVGEEHDIHPKRKAQVGARLALAALALAYGKKVEYAGPVYDGMQVQGDKAVLNFTHVDGGLEARAGPLKGFTIAGADHRFHNAQAEIHGKQVVVWSEEVPHPVAVRYGWANFPVVNLWNKAGLPASPFRTDHFRLTTQRAGR